MVAERAVRAARGPWLGHLLWRGWARRPIRRAASGKILPGTDPGQVVTRISEG